MDLASAQYKTLYIVKQIKCLDEEMTSRFYKLGIFPGVEICLRRKAPLFGDPLLFDVEGSQIALTKSEASLLEVDELQGKSCPL